MQPPDPDELEVSIFGPGYGECVVIHLGDGMWGIVDSCVDKETSENAAVQYLTDLGVAPDQVEFIVATHWHDDHISGISLAVEQYPSASLFLSDAVASDEFLVLTQVFDEPSILSRSGVSEMRRVIEILTERSASSEARFSYAIEGRLLWRREKSPKTSVLALSPSDSAVTAARAQIAKSLPKRLQPKNAIPAVRPNHTGIALWVTFEDIHVLLGNDLEQTSDNATGWDAVIDSGVRPNEKAELVKIAHHGSVNGQSERFWDELISDSPLGLVAPFDRGRVSLPDEEGVEILCCKTAQTYSTSSLRPPSRKKRAGALERQIKEATVWIREAEREMGHVCARKRVGANNWEVALKEPATTVC